MCASPRSLDLVADLLEFQNANPFRVRAYRNGARTVRDYPEQMQSIADDPNRKLTDLDGVGKDLADKIATLVTTGTFPMLEELQSQVPQSVLTLLRIPGMGPKKAATLYKELNVTTLDELRAACEAHQVRGLKGFAAKTEEMILAGMALAQTAGERMTWAEADMHAQSIKAWLQKCGGIEALEIAGSYRRGTRHDRRSRFPGRGLRCRESDGLLCGAARGRRGNRPRADEDFAPH